jgi:hypothetical protein
MTTEADESAVELEMCPFCGREGKIEEFFIDDLPEPWYVATCVVCPLKTYDQTTAEEAAHIWNSRTPPFTDEDIKRVMFSSECAGAVGHYISEMVAAKNVAQLDADTASKTEVIEAAKAWNDARTRVCAGDYSKLEARQGVFAEAQSKLAAAVTLLEERERVYCQNLPRESGAGNESNQKI